MITGSSLGHRQALYVGRSQPSPEHTEKDLGASRSVPYTHGKIASTSDPARAKRPIVFLSRVAESACNQR
jgi:hypothetical protein